MRKPHAHPARDFTGETPTPLSGNLDPRHRAPRPSALSITHCHAHLIEAGWQSQQLEFHFTKRSLPSELHAESSSFCLNVEHTPRSSIAAPSTSTNRRSLFRSGYRTSAARCRFSSMTFSSWPLRVVDQRYAATEVGTSRRGYKRRQRQFSDSSSADVGVAELAVFADCGVLKSK